MFALRARAMGYRVVVLDPDPASPAGLVADVHLRAAYTDARAL
ncbi:MAG: 5-(carboxyamino)imidazole ribonucleotide synthase, partial [Gemmatimonadales bacterium]